MSIKKINFIFFAYFLVAIIYFAWIGNDSLDGLNKIQFYSDSTTYEKMFRDGTFEKSGLIRIDGNLLGPMLLLQMFDGNRWLILIFNCFLFYLSFIVLKSINDLNYKLFFIILMFNPLTFQSLLSVNKEIFVLTSICFFYIWIVRRKPVYALVAIGFGLLARWQLALLIFALLPIISFWNTTILRRIVIFFLSLVFFSLFFKYFSSIFQLVIDSYRNSSHLHEGTGIFITLNEMQLNGYFFITWIFKFLQISFALSFNISQIFNFKNFQNDVVIVIHSLVYLFLFIYSLKKNVLNFGNPFFLPLLLMAVFFSLSFIYSPRYFYAVFVLLALIVSSKNIKIKRETV